MLISNQMFFSNQAEIRRNIITGIKNDKKLFLVKGASGTGKSYLMNEVIEEWMRYEERDVLILAGEDYLFNVELHPFERCLSSNKRLRNNFFQKKSKIAVSKLSRAVPRVGDFLEYVVQNLLTVKELKVEAHTSSLSKDQQDVLFKLQYLLSSHRCLICIDNLHWWDKKSLDLLFNMLQNKESSLDFLSEAVFMINLTTDQASESWERVEKFIRNFQLDVYEINKVTKENYRDTLSHLGLNNPLDNKLIELLYSATDGHLLVTKKIVDYINSNEIMDLQDHYEVLKENSLSVLIEERLKNYGAKGEVVTEVLKYASIIGRSFTFFELEHLTKKNKFEIQECVHRANELSLVEMQHQGANFIHEIVRELFHSKLDENKYFYYHSAAECLKIIKPHQYVARAGYLLQSGQMREAAVLYIVEFVKRLRKREVMDTEFVNSVTIFAKELHCDIYIKAIQTSYELYYSERYKECIMELDIIENLYPRPLLAERDYLLSICLSKAINSKLRLRAVSCLECYENINSLDHEGEIWSRVTSALIVAYIHVNDIVKAKKTRDLLFNYLGARTEFDVDAQDKINILRRKSGAIDSTATALRLTKESVDYFEPQENSTIPLNHFEYFMALNNYTASAMVCGQFQLAFQSASKLLQHSSVFPEVGFPRIEIAFNNYILSGFLSNQLSAAQGIDAFDHVISNKSLRHSDGILIELNKASLLAVNNELDMSKSLLYALQNRLREQSNIESYYEYCVESNLMVVEYLTKNQKTAMDLWDKLRHSLPIIGDEEYYIRRHSIIGSLFNDQVDSNGAEWLDLLFTRSAVNVAHNSGDLWGFYGKGYLFSDMQFWSES